jgi:hypothetical protein
MEPITLLTEGSFWDNREEGEHATQSNFRGEAQAAAQAAEEGFLDR